MPPTTVNPPLVIQLSAPLLCASTETSILQSGTYEKQPTAHEVSSPSSPCLSRLLHAIHQIPLSVPEAGSDHPFAQFSGELKGCVPEGEDAWETWDGPLNTILQKESQELETLVTRGRYGLSALHRFLQYLVTEHGVNSALFEGKIEHLIHAMNSIGIAPKNGPIPNAGSTVIDLTIDCEPNSASNSSIVLRDQIHWHPCPGFCIELPADKSPHTAYPFALHESLGDPWDYSVASGALILRAHNCYHERLSSNTKICPECSALTKNPALIGI